MLLYNVTGTTVRKDLNRSYPRRIGELDAFLRKEWFRKG